MRRGLFLLAMSGVAALSWIWVWQPAFYGDKGMAKKAQLQAQNNAKEQQLRHLRQDRQSMEEKIRQLSSDAPSRQFLSERMEEMMGGGEDDATP